MVRIGRVPAPFVDASLVVIAAVDAVVSFAWMTEFNDRHVVVFVVAVLALTVRRRWPSVVFALTLPLVIVSFSAVATQIALYTVAASTRNRLGLALYALVFALCAAPFPVSGLFEVARIDLLIAFGYDIAAACVAILLGRLVQVRGDLALRLAEIEQARENERSMVAQTVLATERAQLAREMHDVVAHQVSLIAVAAGALQVSTRDPDAKDAAGSIRALSVDTLTELRHMVAVLRASGTTDTDVVPQPTLARLGQLVANSGIDVRIEADLPDAVGAPTQRAIYRTVQEALTNIRRHATGATATLRIWGDGTDIAVVITNTPPTGPSVPLPGTRHGLVGLRERADLLGGVFWAGPTVDGGFQVRLQLPAMAP